jgi:hypothetical protein
MLSINIAEIEATVSTTSDAISDTTEVIPTNANVRPHTPKTPTMLDIYNIYGLTYPYSQRPNNTTPLTTTNTTTTTQTSPLTLLQLPPPPPPPPPGFENVIPNPRRNIDPPIIDQTIHPYRDNSCYRDGYQDGYREGYQDGYQEGYQDGYQAGQYDDQDLFPSFPTLSVNAIKQIQLYEEYLYAEYEIKNKRLREE